MFYSIKVVFLFHVLPSDWNLDYPNSYSLELPVGFFYKLVVINIPVYLSFRTLCDCLGCLKFGGVHLRKY